MFSIVVELIYVKKIFFVDVQLIYNIVFEKELNKGLTFLRCGEGLRNPVKK